MALIKCHECGKEISDKAGICPNCGCPVNIKAELSNENNEREVLNRKTLYIGLGIIIVIVMFFIIFKLLNQNSKEYCEGLKWGTSIKAVEKKYPDLVYDDESDSYSTLVESLDGFSSDGQMIDMHFYFDNKDQLHKIEVDIVSDELDEAILYFVTYFNKIYGEDYEASYDTEYKWLGDDTNVSMTAYSVLLKITYEEVK